MSHVSAYITCHNGNDNAQWSDWSNGNGVRGGVSGPWAA